MVNDLIKRMFSEGFEFTRFFEYVMDYEERSDDYGGQNRPEDIWDEFYESLYIESAVGQFAQCYRLIEWGKQEKEGKRKRYFPSYGESDPKRLKQRRQELAIGVGASHSTELKYIELALDWFNRKEIITQKWGAASWEFTPLRHVAYEYVSHHEDHDPIDVIILYREKLFFDIQHRDDEVVYLPGTYKKLFEDMAQYLEKETGVPIGTVIKDYHELDPYSNVEIIHSLFKRSLECPHGIFKKFTKHFMPSNGEDLITLLNLPYKENIDPKGDPSISGQMVAEMFSNAQEYLELDSGIYNDKRKEVSSAINGFFRRLESNSNNHTDGRLARDCYEALLSDIAFSVYGQTVLFNSDFEELHPNIVVLFSTLFSSDAEMFLITSDIGSGWEAYDYLISGLWAEGYYQLGNALLAFYLVAAIIVDDSYIQDSKGLFDQIKKGLHLPGNTGLKHSVRIVKKRLKDNGHATYLKFDQFDSEQDRILEMIAYGESKTCEFKETLAFSVKENKKNIHLVDAVLRAITAFLNTDGGTLFIGVTDSGEIIGIERDLRLNKNNEDVLLRLLADKIKDHIGSSAIPFINYRIEVVNGKKILVVECEKSDVDIWMNDTNFFIRTVAQSLELKGRKAADYVRAHFN